MLPKQTKYLKFSTLKADQKGIYQITPNFMFSCGNSFQGSGTCHIVSHCSSLSSVASDSTTLLPPSCCQHGSSEGQHMQSIAVLRVTSGNEGMGTCGSSKNAKVPTCSTIIYALLAGCLDSCRLHHNNILHSVYPDTLDVTHLQQICSAARWSWLTDSVCGAHRHLCSIISWHKSVVLLVELERHSSAYM